MISLYRNINGELAIPWIVHEAQGKIHRVKEVRIYCSGKTMTDGPKGDMSARHYIEFDGQIEWAPDGALVIAPHDKKT